VWSCGVFSGCSIKATVDRVQSRAQVAPDVEPPVADKHSLRELGAVGAQERRLATVDVTIMPRLTSRVHVREEAWIRLGVAVEVCVRDSC
jgi:hypothetical protein